MAEGSDGSYLFLKTDSAHIRYLLDSPGKVDLLLKCCVASHQSIHYPMCKIVCVWPSSCLLESCMEIKSPVFCLYPTTISSY